MGQAFLYNSRSPNFQIGSNVLVSFFAEGMVAVPNHNCDAWQPAGVNGMQKGVPPRAMLSIIECKSGN